MRYDADGERWDVYLSKEAPTEGVRSLIFHCESNSSHGWRVAEVPASELDSDRALEELDDDRLDEIYARSQPFDFAHDPKALEDHIGDSRGR
jgi:hypothetical protein